MTSTCTPSMNHAWDEYLDIILILGVLVSQNTFHSAAKNTNTRTFDYVKGETAHICTPIH